MLTVLISLLEICVSLFCEKGRELSWLEHTLDKGGVESSSLSRPTNINWGISSAGRAPDLHSGGQRFDPAILHHETLSYFFCEEFFNIINIYIRLFE